MVSTVGSGADVVASVVSAARDLSTCSLSELEEMLETPVDNHLLLQIHKEISRRKMREMNASIDNISAQMDGANSAMDALSTAQNSRHDTLNRLQADMAAAKALADRLAASQAETARIIAETGTAARVLRTKVNHQSSEIEGLRDAAASVAHSIEVVRQAERDFGVKRASIEDDAKRGEAAISSAKASLASVERIRANAKRNREAIEKMVSVVKGCFLQLCSYAKSGGTRIVNSFSTGINRKTASAFTVALVGFVIFRRMSFS